LKVLLAYLSGTILTPVLLPYIPGRRFSFKGFLTGLLVFLFLVFLKSAGNDYLEILSWFFIITTVSSFMAMNWTGSSTYTSLSGVRKEMKVSVPLQIGFALTGIILQIVGKFI
jgi:acetyl-CoA decarbonylase/synthase complex subunit gamma